jgi:hypothetical protein
MRETLCAGRVKLFAEASVFSTQAVFQYVVGKMASSETIFQVKKWWKSNSVKAELFLS